MLPLPVYDGPYHVGRCQLSGRKVNALCNPVPDVMALATVLTSLISVSTQEVLRFQMGNEAKILEVVENLYATALDDRPWTASLDALSELFGSVSASFEVIEK